MQDFPVNNDVEHIEVTPIVPLPYEYFPPMFPTDDVNNNALGEGPPFKNNWNILQGKNGLATPSEFGSNLFNLTKSLLANAYYSKPVQYGLEEGKEFYKTNHEEVPGQNKFNNIWGAVNTLRGTYSGIKQLRMANKQFKLQRNAWNKSWDATRKNTNEALEYRSKMRHNNDTRKVAEDMKKYGI